MRLMPSMVVGGCVLKGMPAVPKRSLAISLKYSTFGGIG
jgi:hypothetical protein